MEQAFHGSSYKSTLRFDPAQNGIIPVNTEERTPKVESTEKIEPLIEKSSSILEAGHHKRN